MKHYAIKREDGTVSIATLANGTIEELLEKAYNPDRSPVVSHREVDPAKVPSDRTFRDAWTDDKAGDSIDVSLRKARKIQMNRIRRRRDKALVNLDVKLMIATEQKNTTAISRIRALKQELRDIPTTYDLSTTTSPEELAEKWPEAVLNNE